MKLDMWCWYIGKWSKIYWKSSEFQKSKSLFNSGILSIVFGIVISFIIIGINNVNPLLFFQKTFQFAFDNTQNVMNNYTLDYFSVYILGALSVMVGFKTGIFNIGVSGQMLLSGSLVLLFGIEITNHDAGGNLIPGLTMNPILALIIAFFIAIFAGAFLAGIVGFLKAVFNIHEVVTSIMLNWTVWYFTKWLFISHPSLYDSNTIGNKLPDASFSLQTGSFDFIIPLILTVIVVGIVYFIIKFTTLGYKLTGVGYSPNACKYAGINIKKCIIGSTLLSGLISGLLGFVYYLTISKQIQYSSDALPAEGFEVIAVTLVASNSAIGIFLVSMLWSILKVGTLPASQAPDLKMSKDMASLIFGIIIYGASISGLFLKFKPVKWIKKGFYLYKNKNYYKERNKYQALINESKSSLKELKEKHKQELSLLKQNSDKETKTSFKSKLFVLKYLSDRSKIDKYYKNLYDEYKSKIKNDRNNWKYIKETLWKDSFKIGIKSVKTEFSTKIFGLTANLMDAFVNLRKFYLENKRLILPIYKYRSEKNNLKNQFFEQYNLRKEVMSEELTQNYYLFLETKKIGNHSKKENNKYAKLFDIYYKCLKEIIWLPFWAKKQCLLLKIYYELKLSFAPKYKFIKLEYKVYKEPCSVYSKKLKILNKEVRRQFELIQNLHIDSRRKYIGDYKSKLQTLNKGAEN